MKTLTKTKTSVKQTVAIALAALSILLSAAAILRSNNLAVAPVKTDVKMAATASVVNQITVNYGEAGTVISRQVFGDSVEMDGGHFDKMYSGSYFTNSKNIGFNHVRFGGISCEAYDYTKYPAGDNKNYLKWVKYSQDMSGGNPPILCTSVSLPNAAALAGSWAADSKAKNTGVIYWELGNEDYNLVPNDPAAYATAAIAVCKAIKASDSNAKCLANLGPNDAQYWTGTALANWNQKVISLVNSVVDGYVSHLYSTNTYLDTNYFFDVNSRSYSSAPAGAVGISVRVREFDLNKKCAPKLGIFVDNETFPRYTVSNISTGSWQDISSAFSLTESGHTLTLKNIGDVWNESSCKSALYFSNFTVGGQAIPVWDKKDWTYSFLGSSETMKQEITAVKSSIGGKPLFITEYGFNYDPATGYTYSSYKSPETYGWALSQFDWRSNLFTALMFNALISSGVQEAAVWSDVSSGYWSHLDILGQPMPLYYILQSYAAKTGTNLVSYSGTLDKFSSQSNIVYGVAPAASNIPYLSILPTKSGNKYYLAIVNRDQDNDQTLAVLYNTPDAVSASAIRTTLSMPSADSPTITSNWTTVGSPVKIDKVTIVNNSLSIVVPKNSIVFIEAEAGTSSACVNTCTGYYSYLKTKYYYTSCLQSGKCCLQYKTVFGKLTTKCK